MLRVLPLGMTIAPVLALSAAQLLAQADPPEGRWVAVGGSVHGDPIAEAALPFIRVTFDGDSASWTIPGFPQRFGYRLYGSGTVDSMDFQLPAYDDRRWTVPVRAWQRGDTLELSMILAEPFDTAGGGPPARPASPGPAKVEGHLQMLLVREGPAVTGAAPILDPAEQSAADAVDAGRIHEWTRALVAPEMEGRGAGQPGGDRAARAVARWFAEVGLEPLGEDGFLQRVPLILGRATAASSLTIDDTTFAVGGDFQLAGLVMRTRPEMRAELSGELVLFAGGVPSARADAPLPRFDVAGKVVGWAIAAVPPGTDMFRTYEALHASGAAGVVLLSPGPLPPPALRSPFFGLVPALDADLYGERAGMPAAVLGAGPFTELFGDGGAVRELMRGAAASPSVIQPTGRRVTIAYELEDVAEAPSYNVVGVIRGSDPELRDEAVVYTAHHDALGMVDGDVYAGAADNALGTAEMVEVARAILSSGVRPRRSLVFIAAGAEERGVLGSLHWVRNPTWPLDRVVANVNLDGGDAEAFGPLRGVIDLIPISGLGDHVATIAAAYGLPALPNDEPRGRGSSDFHDFLRAGIPGTQLMGIGGDPALAPRRADRFAGELVHRPGDVIGEDWDWAGPRQMAQIYLLLGLRLANADARPAFPPTAPFGPEVVR